jgi:ribose transport system substrate-binding protein
VALTRPGRPGLAALLLAAAAGCSGPAREEGRGAPGSARPVQKLPDECAPERPAAPGLLKIAVVPKGTTHEFWKAVHAGAVKAERELEGVQVLWKGPAKEDDREQQINVVENFIDAGAAGIVLAPSDDTALVRPVREAARAGVGVVIMDSGLDATPCRDYASFVATDNLVGGEKAARRLAEVVGAEGRVILLRYQVGHSSTTRREEGFLRVVAAEFPRIQVVSSDQYGGTTTESAYAKAESLLNRFPEVDGVFCPNESTTFGMLLALQKSGRAGRVALVGFDTSEKLVRALGAGEIAGLVVQDPLRMGYTAVTTLAAYLRGEPVPPRIDTGSVVATPGNLAEPRLRELLAPPLGRYLE